MRLGGALIVVFAFAAAVAASNATRIARGWEDFRMGEYNSAIDAFEEALEGTKPAEPEHLHALYGLGAAWNLRRPDQDVARAREYYERLIDMAPRSELAAWSMLALARMNMLIAADKTPDYEAARRDYQRVIDHFPNHRAGDEAFLMQQATLLVTLDEARTREAVKNLEAFLRERPDTKFKSATWSLMGDAFQTLGDAERQVKARIQAVETRELDPTNPRVDLAIAYWHIASLAEFEAGDFETARKYYRKLIEEYPRDQKVYPAKLSLERMDETEAEIRERLAAKERTAP